MTQFIPLRQHGRLWGEIDPRNWLLKVKKQNQTAIFDLRVLLAEEVQALIPRPGEELPELGPELPELGPDEAIATVKRIAAASPFNRENGHG